MNEPLLRTPLYDEHVALGGKIVPFAGFEMPVQYPSGITAEHRAVREAAGLFDVSHMGEFLIRGPQALDLVQRVTVNDASKMSVGQAQYSAMCLDSGGVVDDLIVYRFADHYMLVVNASNVAKDLAWVRGHVDGLDVDVEDASPALALIALQGPKARDIVRPLAKPDIDSVKYYRFAEGTVAGIPAVIAGTGYTGEDGFELCVAAENAVPVWRSLMEAGRAHGLVPTGLGSRDSLRLEMGYALYGNDLDEEHTPLESGLGWITKLEKGDFVGRDVLVRQKEEGIPRRLVGMTLEGKGFPRHGYPVMSGGRAVGVLTSGTVSPSLGIGVAMGYVPPDLSKPDTPVQIDVRGKALEAVIRRPPFYTEGSIRR
ncbi:MAG: glycine cleavage system aminomethyltransferase GcvT [Gemmatimonadetes bacterium]|nr:glycine cleavage system aminomethyltransferase GcvT [Gemmatimonadota bacterium]